MLDIYHWPKERTNDVRIEKQYVSLYLSRREKSIFNRDEKSFFFFLPLRNLYRKKSQTLNWRLKTTLHHANGWRRRYARTRGREKREAIITTITTTTTRVLSFLEVISFFFSSRSWAIQLTCGLSNQIRCQQWIDECKRLRRSLFRHRLRRLLNDQIIDVCITSNDPNEREFSGGFENNSSITNPILSQSLSCQKIHCSNRCVCVCVWAKNYSSLIVIFFSSSFFYSATMGNHYSCHSRSSRIMLVFGLLYSSNVSKVMEKERCQRWQRHRFTSCEIVWFA